MLAINTGRLRLLALATEQLRLYLAEQCWLEDELGLNPSLLPAGQALRRAIGLKLTAMAQVDDSLLPWYTYWLIIDITRQIGAGLIGFKGAPDDDGQVEIGYGIEPACRRQGFATEAVGGLVKWAFAAPSCQMVMARTQASNEASAAVLRKVGFRRCGIEEEHLLWCKDNQKS